MQSFEILKKSEFIESFHDKIIVDTYSITHEHLEKKISGEIDIEGEWNIGLIVGNSGTGKSTIAKELFKKEIKIKKFNSKKSIIGNFSQKTDIKKITETLSKLGLNSPPLWLQTYNTLSNGERMRAELALNLITSNFFVYDEFTSVVDRNVAKITSHVLAKYIRKENKKFVAVSCHFDIIDWLQPSWILNTNDMSFKKRRLLRRPDIKLEIKEEKGKWNLFRRYHYLNSNLHRAARQFIGYVNGVACCFCGILFQPGCKIKGYRVHRLVCIPDYQGLGIGIKMLDYIADKYIAEGTILTIVTSNYSLVKNIRKINNWKITAKGHKTMNKGNLKDLKNTESIQRYTISCRKTKESV